MTSITSIGLAYMMTLGVVIVTTFQPNVMIAVQNMVKKMDIVATIGVDNTASTSRVMTINQTLGFGVQVITILALN